MKTKVKTTKKRHGVMVDKILESCKDLSQSEQRSVIHAAVKEMLVDDYGNPVIDETLLTLAFLNRLTYNAPTNRKETRRIAEELYRSHPLVKWFINLVTAFVIGGEFEVRTGGEEIISVLVNRFMDLNETDYLMKKYHRADMCHGEGFYRLFIITKDGQKAGALKGDIIIRRLATNTVDVDFNPSDPQDVNYYILNWYDPVARQRVVEKILPYDKFIDQGLIKNDDVKKTPGGRKRTVIRGNSCIIHFKLNDFPNDIYGTSDVKALMEWAELYAEHLRTGVLQTKLRGGGAYDITIEEDNEKEFDTKAEPYRNWTIGDNFVHNKGVEIDTLEFDSPVEGFEEIRRALLLMFIAGSELSEHYTGDSKSGSRAQGQTMELPQMKSLEDRQTDYEWLWRNILRTVINIQILNGIPKDPKIKSFKKDKTKAIDILRTVHDKSKFGVKLPTVSRRDRTRMLENLKTEIEIKTVSVQTASSELGRDFEEESKKNEEYNKQFAVEDIDKDADKDRDISDEDRDRQTDEPPEKAADGSATPENRRDQRKKQ